jgi:hypothetical protein
MYNYKQETKFLSIKPDIVSNHKLADYQPTRNILLEKRKQKRAD